LCSLPRARWTQPPPGDLGDWPVLRHLRHLALREIHQTLPLVRQALGEPPAEAHAWSTRELEQADATWDAASPACSAAAILRDLGSARFELLRRLEAAPDDLWQAPVAGLADAAAPDRPPADVTWLLLDAHQHELHHLAAIWRIALHWDRLSRSAISSVPLHPADRLEESH
jgi:hypothetical protein